MVVLYAFEWNNFFEIDLSVIWTKTDMKFWLYGRVKAIT